MEANYCNRLSLLFLCAYLVIFPTLRSYTADFDEVWQQRAEEAKKNSKDAHEPNPEKVTKTWNKHINNNKAIDGRGANGAQITMQFVKNMNNLHIHDNKAGKGGLIRNSVDQYGYRTESDGDGISMYGSSDVWIDHISLSHCKDGLIDAIMASTAITISHCHLTNHNELITVD